MYNLEIEEKTKVVNSSKYFLSIKMMSSYPRKLILLIQSSNKTFDNKGNIRRGRLAQRESVRLVIQRSEFDSRSRWIFLSRRGRKMRDPIYSNHFSSVKKYEQRHLLETRKAVFNSPSEWKGIRNLKKLVLWRHTYWWYDVILIHTQFYYKQHYSHFLISQQA